MEFAIKTRLDYDDYCAIPTDGKRYELIDGEVHVTPAPSPEHQRVVLRLARALQESLSPPAEVFVSPVDVILGPHDVVQPDLVVVADPSQVSSRGIEGAPLLVIEVLSPTSRVYDTTTKSQRYAALGISHYWIVDPASHRVECYRRDGLVYRPVSSFGPDDILTHPDFPTIQFPLSQLWQ